MTFSSTGLPTFYAYNRLQEKLSYSVVLRQIRTLKGVFPSLCRGHFFI